MQVLSEAPCEDDSMAEKQRLPEPPYLKGFFVLLPDAMPVPNGSTWTFLTEELEPLLDGMVLSPAPHLPPTPSTVRPAISPRSDSYKWTIPRTHN